MKQFMAGNQTDNHASWKNALDELSVLPDEAMRNSEASWNILETRLKQSKNAYRKYLYWMAAASIFISIAVAGWLILQYPNESSGQRTFAKSAAQPLHNENIITGKHSGSVIKKSDQTGPIKTATKKMVMEVAATTKDTMQELVTITNPSSLQIPEDTVQHNQELVNISTQLRAKPVVFPALKRKIPVVHLNEIEQPVHPFESVAGNNDRNAASTLIRKQIIQDDENNLYQNGTIIRIKLSPQN